METTFINLQDMPIPDYAYANRHDGTVYTITMDASGKKHRKTIGRLTVDIPGEERMIPNRYFREHFWNDGYGAHVENALPQDEYSVGMYALTLSIADQTGIYEELKTAYGMKYANNILDYVMFFLLHGRTTKQRYEATMDREILFSEKRHDEAWYDGFFSVKITEDMTQTFHIERVRRLSAQGVQKVWLSVHSPDRECAARQSDVSRLGADGSGSKGECTEGYMYAFDPATGRPVTYFTYEGNVPVAQVFQQAASFFKGSKIDIEGIVLDRNFAQEAVFAAIEERHWKYIVMLPSDAYAHREMVEEYGNSLRWNAAYMLDDEVLFATSDRKQLFGKDTRESNICTYFDGTNSAKQAARLSRDIHHEKQKLEEAIKQGKDATVSPSLESYLSIEGEGQGRIVTEHNKAWNESMAQAGFFSIAVSDGMSVGTCHRIFRSRDVFETQYAILKLQEDGETPGAYSTEGLHSKLAVTFIASILWFEIGRACIEMELDIQETLQQLDNIMLLRTAQGDCQLVRSLTENQMELFARFGFTQDDFERLSTELTARNMADGVSPARTLADHQHPVMVKNSHKRGRPKKPVSEDTSAQETVSAEKPKVGRPKGKTDTKPRKPRSDKGSKRGPRENKANSTT